MSNAFAGTAALVLAIAGGAAPLAAQQRASADMILTNARVYTVEARQPWAEAVAIQDGRIVAVGSEAQVGTLRTAATRVVEVGGRLVLPAFGDAHVRSEEHTSEHQSLMRISYAVFCLKKKKQNRRTTLV